LSRALIGVSRRFTSGTGTARQSWTARGLEYYRERMGVAFPEGTEPFELVLMRR
jgi:hypothetical protein